MGDEQPDEWLDEREPDRLASAWQQAKDIGQCAAGSGRQRHFALATGNTPPLGAFRMTRKWLPWHESGAAAPGGHQPTAAQRLRSLTCR